MVASLREQLQEYHCSYRSLTLEENIVAVVIQDKAIDDNFKRQTKNRTLCACRLFYQPKFFNIAISN